MSQDSKTNPKTYNGWTNYETWLVKIWLDNDQASYENIREITSQAKDAYELAEMLQAELEEVSPLAEVASVYSDLLRAAIGEVNFYEIASSIIQELLECPECHNMFQDELELEGHYAEAHGVSND